MFTYDHFFPYPEVRPEQDKAIQFALNAFLKDDKRFVIVEAGTGVGKSAIGFTIAKYLNHDAQARSTTPDDNLGTYYLTTQKVLQEQYMKDFKSKGMLSLQSSVNFRCKYYKSKTCAQARRELKATQDHKFKANCQGGGCRYMASKKKFIDGYHGVTNFAYFLAETHYAGQLTPRKLMIVDECHNTELQLGSFIDITISENFAKNVLKLNIPTMTTEHQVFTWITKTYKPKLFGVKKHYETQIEKLSLAHRLPEFLKVSQQFELLDKHLCKLCRFIDHYDKKNWVMNESRLDNGTRKWEFKPICVGPFSESYLFKHSEKVLLMSATVMNQDAFCEVLGIDKSECAFISIPSPFPIENRPIVVSPIASMSKNNIDQGLPQMAKAVKAILDAHPKEKGIIHCHSYKIAKYLKKNIRSRRLLTHTSTDRERILKKHIADSRPTVLLSPSMQEGVDLKGDSSRFQILCKIPFPYLGDKLIRKRMHKWKWWYPLQTAKTIVQSVGRSVRSNDDSAITYILDADWERFYNNHSNLFPKGFKDCIQR